MATTFEEIQRQITQWRTDKGIFDIPQEVKEILMTEEI